MEIKNSLVEQLLGQISGLTLPDMKPIGLLNFTPSLKGKLRRKLQYLSQELNKQFEFIKAEAVKIKSIESEENEQEFNDLMDENFMIPGFEKIPLSWIDEIETSVHININFLLEHILFDDTK